MILTRSQTSFYVADKECNVLSKETLGSIARGYEQSGLTGKVSERPARDCLLTDQAGDKSHSPEYASATVTPRCMVEATSNNSDWVLISAPGPW